MERVERVELNRRKVRLMKPTRDVLVSLASPFYKYIYIYIYIYIYT